MSEKDEVTKANLFISQGKKKEAEEILWTLSESVEALVKIEAVMGLLYILDAVKENDKLLQIVGIGIDAAEKTGMKDVFVFLLSKKCVFLANRLSMIVHRQKCLMLSAGVFHWIGFSLERDKSEYEHIIEMRTEIEAEINSLLNTALKMVEDITDYYYRGNVYSSISDYYSNKYFLDHLDFMKGERLRSKIANFHFIRRWRLDKYLYERNHRLQFIESMRKLVIYSKKSISEYEKGGHQSELAHAMYNLAVRYNSIFCFRKAKNVLSKARRLATSNNEGRLLEQIALLEKRVADKNKHIPDYVGEMGLDLP